MIFSYSLLSQHASCPEAARQIFVLRNFKKTWTVQGGIDEHKLLEDRLKAKRPLPPQLAASERYAQSLEKMGVPVQVEVGLAVDRDLKPVDFWAKTAWLRGKYDVRIVAPPRALIGDWKTGKKRESPDQLELGALLTFANDPQVDVVTGVNVWLNAGGMGPPYVFKRFEPRWAPWLKKMGMIEQADPAKEWEKKPGPLCNYCPVAVCAHSAEYRRWQREK
jgi:PD-(D/E)XK nuclease superfamily protein